jgi:hypothetical protein
MVPATGNVYLIKTPAGDVVIDTAMAEIAGEVMLATCSCPFLKIPNASTSG